MKNLLDFLFNCFLYSRNIFEAFCITIFLSKVWFFESFWMFLIISFWFYNYNTKERIVLTHISLIHYSIVLKELWMIGIWFLYYLILFYPILYVKYYSKTIDT